MIRALARAALCCALTAGASRAHAQASIVPVTHPVYDWLAQQRLEGRLPTYEHEVRPMSRATIVAHLRTLDAMGDRLGGRERRLLADFTNEFEFDRLAAQRVWTREFVRSLPRLVPEYIRTRRDPVLWTIGGADSLLSGAFYGKIGAGILSLDEAGSPNSAYATTKGVKVFLNTSYGLGWHFEYDDIWTSADAPLVVRIPRYDNDAIVAGSTGSYEFDSYLSYRTARWFEGLIGWGAQSLGPAITDPLVLRPDAPSIPYVRLRMGGPRFNLVYVHGVLRSKNTDDTAGTPTAPVYNRTAPDRFFAGHRLTWMPTSRMSITAHEQVIYANRGPDLSYNPVVPMQFMQPRAGDRDNLLVGFDAVYRPRNGTQILGSVLVDDVGDTFGPFKQGATIGVEQRLIAGTRLGVGYTWTDPFLYTHWIRLNTYESIGKPLGAAIGPNSEEAAIRITSWLPLRTRVMAGYRRQLRGLDPVGAAANDSLCVGGNIMCGLRADEAERFGPRFLNADKHRVARAELELWTEPIRGLPFILNVRDERVREGSQLVSYRFIDFRFRYGY